MEVIASGNELFWFSFRAPQVISFSHSEQLLQVQL
jgi:hypothetical protein